MTIIEGLRTFLLQNNAIAALVSARVYPLRLPQKAVMPSIVLTRIDDIGDAHLRGPNALTRARVQVDCWAQTFDDAVALGDLCQRRLDGYQGSFTDASTSPPSVLQVQSILADSASDHFEEEILGGLCRQGTDYFVTYAAVGESILI